MSACLIAMIILGILSIFSAKYRYWAKEAFFCVGRRLTIRPCDTGFDQKVKSKVTSSLMKRNRRFARVVHKNFEIISWIFTASLFISLFYTGYAVFNLATFGTCDPTHPDECVFNPDLPSCDGSACDSSAHCLCGMTEIYCDDPLFIECDGDCTCVCSGGDAITGT